MRGGTRDKQPRKHERRTRICINARTMKDKRGRSTILSLSLSLRLKQNMRLRLSLRLGGHKNVLLLLPVYTRQALDRPATGAAKHELERVWRAATLRLYILGQCPRLASCVSQDVTIRAAKMCRNKHKPATGNRNTPTGTPTNFLLV